MFVSHPYSKKETLRIVESRPKKSSMPSVVKAIEIHPDPDWRKGAKPDEVEEILDRITKPDNVKVLSTHYSCKISRLPDLSRFKNLQYLHLAGGKVQKYEFASNLQKLKSLFLVSYKESNLDRFSHARLEYFRAIRGRITHLKIHSETVFLQSCSKLLEFGESNIYDLQLNACHNIDLDSLKYVRGLHDLEILRRKSLPSFDFIGSCPELKSIVVTATVLGQADLSALEKHSKLQKIWLSAPNKRIKELALANRKAVVTNGDICYLDGEIMDLQKTYYGYS